VTGFGVVERCGSSVRHVAHGTLRAVRGAPLAERLAALQAGLVAAIAAHAPEAAVVERVFAGRSARSALVLGHARGVALAAAAAAGLPVFEYTAPEIKLAVAGNGAAEKRQVQAMVERLLALERPRPSTPPTRWPRRSATPTAGRWPRWPSAAALARVLAAAPAAWW
jgi:crossover junction endodeoxyribonuclease RuvC